jgi:hypothetical protein
MTTRFGNFDELRRARAVAYKAAWYAAHREEQRAGKATHYLEHREEYLARAAARYATRRDEILATYDPAERAAVHVARREADAAYGKIYNAAHAQGRHDSGVARRAAYRRWLRSITAQCLCVSCGATKRLHFHHRDPATKLFWVGRNPHPTQQTLDEMKKCDVLCESCHHRLHSRLRRRGSKNDREETQ